MSTAQKASLEAVIEKWVTENCEDIDVYWPDGFSQEMVSHIASVIGLMQNSNAKCQE